MPAPFARPVSRRDGLDRKVVEMLPLVKWQALKIWKRLPAHVDVDDLIGAGCLGLVDAVRKFDPGRQVRFESYARHRIRGEILDSLRNMDYASRDMRKKSKQAEKVHRDLEAKLGRPVGSAEMAHALGMSLDQWYRELQEMEGLGLGWLRPAGSVKMTEPFEASAVADGRENPFEQCYRQEQRDILARALSRLSERERLIISLYHDQALTMKQIAAKLGVDESRVSQLHSAALLRLRTRVRAMLNGSYPNFASRPTEAREGVSRLSHASSHTFAPAERSLGAPH